MDKDEKLTEGIGNIRHRVLYEQWLVGSQINIISGIVILILFVGSLFVPGLWSNINESWRLFCMLWPSGMGLLYLGLGIYQRRDVLKRIEYEKLHGVTRRKNTDPFDESFASYSAEYDPRWGFQTPQEDEH